MVWPFSKARKKNDSPEAAHRTMAEFIVEAEQEIDRQIREDPDWYKNLPYQGGLSPEEARGFEIEKRAMWKRVIYDAGRSELAGLKWVTRQDKLTCQDCRAYHGRVFAPDELKKLALVPIHLGCRCELRPVR